MHSKIIETLKPLGIDIDFMTYDGNSKEYIIFSIYDDEDSDFSDDSNESETFYINLSYWTKDKSKIKKYKGIKETMKASGFIYDDGKDLKDKDYVGRSLDFIYVENEENEYE